MAFTHYLYSFYLTTSVFSFSNSQNVSLSQVKGKKSYFNQVVIWNCIIYLYFFLRFTFIHLCMYYFCDWYFSFFTWTFVSLFSIPPSFCLSILLITFLLLMSLLTSPFPSLHSFPPSVYLSLYLLLPTSPCIYLFSFFFFFLTYTSISLFAFVPHVSLLTLSFSLFRLSFCLSLSLYLLPLSSYLSLLSYLYAFPFIQSFGLSVNSTPESRTSFLYLILFSRTILIIGIYNNKPTQH